MKIKLIIWIIGMLLIAGSVRAGLTDEIFVNYNFDNNDFNDSTTNNYDAYNSGTINSTGIIQDGRYFDGVNDWVNYTASARKTAIAQGYTIAFWVKSTNTTRRMMPLGSQVDVNNFVQVNINYEAGGVSSGSICVDTRIGGTFGNNCDSATGSGQQNLTNGSWHFVALVWNSTGSGITYYTDGIARATRAVTAQIFPNIYQRIGTDREGTSTYSFNGNIDEWSVWNRTLTPAEITQLYNSGSGFTYPFAQMTISGITPANGTNSTVQLTAEFTYNSFDSSAGNCTLYINGIANATNNSIASGSAATLSASGMGYGYYNWSIGCLSATIAKTSTGNFTYYLDPNAPVCNFPASVLIGYMEDSYTFNVTCTDEHFYSLNVSCDGDLFEHFIDGLDTTAYNFTNTTVFANTTVCSYEYCDGHTDSIIDNVDFIELPVDKDGRAKIDILKDAIPIGSFKSDTIGAIITPAKLDDRISFKVDLKASIALTHTFYYTTLPGSKYIANADFPGWIITYNSRSWFDMKSKQVNPKDLKVKKLNSTTWEFTITTSEKLLEFESTGSLNCVTGSFNILYEADYTFHPGTCPADTAGSIMFTMLVFFCLGLMAFAMIFRIRFFGIFAALMLIGLSWSVAACAKIPGLAFGGFAIVALIWFAVKE